MEAFRVHIKPLEKEHGICKQDPYFEILENMQQRSQGCVRYGTCRGVPAVYTAGITGTGNFGK